MKKFIGSLLIVLIFNYNSNAQDDNTISLRNLSSCAMKMSVNDADELISKYGYTLVGNQKEKYQGKDCDRFTFIKESNGIIKKIYLYKNVVFDPFDRMLKVLYYSLFSRNFNSYKKELESDKENIFKKEKSEGGCFERYYQGLDFDYNFAICETEYQNNPVYVIKINFNNGAGILRKK